MSNGRRFRRRCAAHDVVHITIPDTAGYVDMIGDPATDDETARVAAAILLNMTPELREVAGVPTTAAGIVDALRELQAAGIHWRDVMRPPP